MNTKEIFDIYDSEHSLFSDNSIKEFEYVEFPPINTTNLNTTGNKEIVIQQQDLITFPSDAYLYFEGELTKSDGTDIAAADYEKVSLINNSMMYLFERMTYLINGNVVEDIDRPGQTTSMLGMFKYSIPQSSSNGLSMSWLPDIDYNANESNNSMVLRSRFKKFSFNVPLDHIFGFMEDYKKVLYGVQQTFRLKRLVNHESLQVMKGENKTDFKLSLSKMSLFIPVIKPSLETEIKLYDQIDKKKILKILFRGRNTQTFIPAANSTNLSWNLQNTTGTPRYIVIGMQKNNLFSKSNFSNLELKKILVEINTRRYPNHDIEIDYPEEKYSRIFKQSYDFKKNFYDTDEPPSFSYITFKSLYPIYVIDISKYDDRTRVSNMDIQIKATFNSAPGTGVEVFATLLSDIELSLHSSDRRFNLIS
ncbi:uncharacterized protein LOC115212234 [Octopus sinensis]|uniref:Uncharacterized protein LOC115212234 n=1 Tax=Octopus sinensis TaxID=2607531 RepID=A0A6P7SG53_9MOLL|nr:uncharacterized protein LOC115212234 [Octopus sinensis]